MKKKNKQASMITVGYYKDLWNSHKIKVPINIPLASHVCLVGASGTGKSMSIQFMLKSILLSNEDVVLHFFDFKKSSDFIYLEGKYKYFYAGENCIEGLRKLYQSFTKARENQDMSKVHYIVFDEWASFLLYCIQKHDTSKNKISKEMMGIVSEILMLGRGLNYFIMICMQRGDTIFFGNNGARDNFMYVICLGKISQEQKNMFFRGEEIETNRIYRKGEGVISGDTLPLTYIQVPKIHDIESWKAHILDILLTRSEMP